MDKIYAVSITREFGSLGRPIARRLSEILQIEIYDRDILEQSAKNLNMPVSIISQTEESANNRFFGMQFPLGQASSKEQKTLFESQKKIIKELAWTRSCVIVGRCSDYILREHPNHFSAYVFAPYEKRIQNCITQLHLAPQEAVDMIRSIDKARESYHRAFAGYSADSLCNRDAMLDSSSFGIEDSAAILAEMVMRKCKHK